MKLIKAHAFGNDFLLVDAYDFSGLADPLTFTRDVCSRHRGIGADGLIVFETRSAGASMQLFNADGSRSEISGNGVRCLAAWIASTQQLQDGTFVDIETDAGLKSLELLDRREGRYTFCAAMGQPERIEQVVLDVDGESVTAVTLRVGNPQCVVLGEVTDARLQTIGRALAVHSHFPEGTNVELATVEAPNRVRILIWERGVGPTESSGTGSCAAAVAAISFGGASRDLADRRAGWDAARRMGRGGAVPDRLGGNHRREPLAEILMRSLHEAGEAVETYSPAEELFNRRRGIVGLVGGPLALVVLLLAPLPIAAPAHRLAAILLMMVILWITEALPLAVTALIGPVLAVILQVAPARTVFAPFADPIIFLFIGSFMLAEAMFAHGLDRRIAFGALSSRAVGGSPTRILLVYGAVATGISMWISNTATTAMMFPIGLSIVAHLTKGRESDVASRNFATAMMLMAAFGASIGGMGTPIGTPPNLIGKGMLERIAHEHISFFQWMMLGVPLAVLLFVFLVVYFRWRLLKGLKVDLAQAAHIQDELRKLGPISAGQRNTLIAFATTVALWLFPGVLAIAGLADSGFARAYEAAVPESIAAMIGAILLFLLPVNWRARRFTLSWEQAIRIDWGIILLFGGGLAMGALAFSTGLAEAVGHGITSWLPVRSTFSLTVLFTAVAIVMSETASNTASANMIVPVAIAVAQASGIDPLEPALGATFGASMGFMMPISTPPNAIVYSSGHVPITAMMRHGIALDIAGFIFIVLVVSGLGWVI